MSNSDSYDEVQTRRARLEHDAVEHVLEAVDSPQPHHSSPRLRLVLLGKVNEDGQDVEVGD